MRIFGKSKLKNLKLENIMEIEAFAHNVFKTRLSIKDNRKTFQTAFLSGTCNGLTDVFGRRSLKYARNMLKHCISSINVLAINTYFAGRIHNLY